jgi:hypothetical protein
MLKRKKVVVLVSLSCYISLSLTHFLGFLSFSILQLLFQRFETGLLLLFVLFLSYYLPLCAISFHLNLSALDLDVSFRIYKAPSPKPFKGVRRRSRAGRRGVGRSKGPGRRRSRRVGSAR